MFSKTRGMSVRLITSSNFAIVGLVTRVYMTVFFPVTRIGKSSIASLKFAAEWFLSCKKKKKKKKKNYDQEQEE